MLGHLKNQFHYLKKIKRKERKPDKSKHNKEELCCREEASACAPEEPILFPVEDKKKSKLPKSKLNKEELCCNAEASACAPEEPILLPEEDKRKRKENQINPSSIKKNCVAKQKQVLVHLRNQYYCLKKIKIESKQDKLISHTFFVLSKY